MRHALIAAAAALVAFIVLFAVAGGQRPPAPAPVAPLVASTGEPLVNARRFTGDIAPLIAAARRLSGVMAELAADPAARARLGGQVTREATRIRAYAARMRAYRVSERRSDRMRARIVPAADALAESAEDFLRAVTARNSRAAIAALRRWEAARERLSASGQDDGRAVRPATPPQPRTDAPTTA